MRVLSYARFLCSLLILVILQKMIFSEECSVVMVSDVLRPLPKASDYCPQSFGRCALVGGSSSLNGSGHGVEIEAHDTVIRVNRLPHPKHFVDVGRRTDVYFVNTLKKYRLDQTKLEWEMGVNPRFVWCRHSPRNCSCLSCPKHIIFEGAPYDIFWNHGKVLHGQAALNAAKAAALTVDKDETIGTTKISQHSSNRNKNYTACRQSHALHFFQHNVPAVPYAFRQPIDRGIRDAVAPWAYKSRPSGGLKAFFTLAMICDSISLFGFSGSKSLDGHREVGHNFKAEHVLYSSLFRAGSILSNQQKQDFRRRQRLPPPKRPLSLSPEEDAHDVNNFFARAFHETYMKRPFALFSERIACLARNGRIALIH